MKKVRGESKIWEYVNQKNTIGMCLFNLESQKIEMHNESLVEIMGAKSGEKIENIVLRPKKKKIQRANQETLLKKYDEKELHKESITLDKTPKPLKDVIVDVINCLYVD